VTKPRDRFGVLEGGTDTTVGGGDEEPRRRRLVLELLSGQRSFELLFQPIVNVFGPRTVGYEMLSRFKGAHRFRPDEIFRTAGAMDLGGDLEALVLARALKERARAPRNTFVTVNVSPHLLDHPMLRRVLDRELAGVVIELTEHAEVNDLDALTRAIAWLRARGAMIAMDDAGAGYSGLKMLTLVRPDIVKLDRDLITGIERDEVKALMCAALGDFVGRIDAWLLAEGVERPAELARVLQIGVPLVQGYALGYPAREPEQLSDELASQLRALAPRRDELRDPISQLGESVLLARGHAPSGTPCCRLGSNGRPIELELDEDAPAIPVTLTVHADDPMAEVALRAVARSAGTRFDPIVIVDDQGTPRQFVRMERLVSALAGFIPTPSGAPRASEGSAPPPPPDSRRPR
jgi:EAL domain-containing protein (putative c-di-GMP-specific phosphodiesterase class I)